MGKRLLRDRLGRWRRADFLVIRLALAYFLTSIPVIRNQIKTKEPRINTGEFRCGIHISCD
jgi:hypothetical protein